MIGITRYKWGVPGIPLWAPPRCNRSCQHLQSAVEDTVGYARRQRTPTAVRWQDPALKTIFVNWHHRTRGEDHWVPECLLICTLQIDLFCRASQFHRCLWQRCICDARVVMFRCMSFHCASDFWRHWQIWKCLAAPCHTNDCQNGLSRPDLFKKTLWVLNIWVKKTFSDKGKKRSENDILMRSWCNHFTIHLLFWTKTGGQKQVGENRWVTHIETSRWKCEGENRRVKINGWIGRGDLFDKNSNLLMYSAQKCCHTVLI